MSLINITRILRDGKFGDPPSNYTRLGNRIKEIDAVVVPPAGPFLIDPTDDFLTDDTVKWGGHAPAGGTVTMLGDPQYYQKWSKFWYDPATDFGFTVDAVNINRGIFAGANGVSPIIIELVDSENGAVIGTHAVGITSAAAGGENMYAWSNTENEQLLTSANLGSAFSCQFVCSWDSAANVFSADIIPSTGGTYSVSTTAQAPAGNIWVRIRMDDNDLFAEAELDTFTGDSGLAYVA